jgi:hypothetical protein
MFDQLKQELERREPGVILQIAPVGPRAFVVTVYNIPDERFEIIKAFIEEHTRLVAKHRQVKLALRCVNVSMTKEKYPEVVR